MELWTQRRDYLLEDKDYRKLACYDNVTAFFIGDVCTVVAPTLVAGHVIKISTNACRYIRVNMKPQSIFTYILSKKQEDNLTSKL